MRCGVILCAILVLSGFGGPEDRKPTSAPPSQFEIDRHTFLDFGPPTDFYELFLVRSDVNGAHIDRITLTPATDECFAPAKLETASASLSGSVESLWGGMNPCAIPENALRRELKRCKHCLVFSGADVAMQVQCGNQTRLIRSDILDRDMFDPGAKTPEHTSWTMQLLERLDQAVGNRVIDKPMLAVSDEEEPTAPSAADRAILQDLSEGKYDLLFRGSPDKPSDLYRVSEKHLAIPTVRLVSSVPFQPEALVLPQYPAIAKVAHIQGPVSAEADIDADGAVTNLTVDGPKLLFRSVSNAAKDWRFPKDAFGQHVHVTILFDLNCPKPTQ
jgi:Gram-negative bacterial TonB protein C-terminal